MIGWIVANTSSCGSRTLRSRFRFAITQVSVTQAARPGRRRDIVAGSVVPCSRRRRFVCVFDGVFVGDSLGRRVCGPAGQREEHVVERRAFERELERLDPCGVELRSTAISVWLPCVAADLERPAATLGRTRRVRATRGGPRRGPRRGPGVCTVLSPNESLSSSAVPSEMIEPRSITPIRSASSSASSRYWVVSSTVVPASIRSRISSQMSTRLRGIDAGRRLVEEQHLGSADE